jgi:SNF2 family DNA or RNA helicase
VIVHPEMVMVQAWWVCQHKITRKRRGKTLTKLCNRRTAEGAKQQRELNCGHIKDRKTKYELVPAYAKLFSVEWGAVVVDESHESLIRRTGKPTQRRRGLEMLKVRPDGLKIAMSGTPFDSKPHQLWGTLNWLDPKTYSAFHRWAELYWQKGGYTGFELGEFRKDRENMLWDSLSAISLRRTKAEVAKDLPPKMEIGTPLAPGDPSSPIGIWLEMEDKQASAYKAMEETSIAELESGRLEAITALAELTRLKQLACSYGDIVIRQVKARCEQPQQIGNWRVPLCRDCKRYGWHWADKYQYTPQLPSNKFTWIAQSLEEWGFPKNPITKVVIVSFYTGILELFSSRIEQHFRTKVPLCSAITGRTPTKERRSIIDRFNERGKDSPQIMMLNVKAGGTAITLDTADRMIFISETRIPDQQKQAEDRIHRVSNPRQCMYYYLRSIDTVDVGTALVNQQMIADTHRLLDQRRGVHYMRSVLDLSRPFS